MVPTERLYTFIPKINFLLTLSAIIMLSYLALKMLQPYRVITLAPRESKLEPFALTRQLKDVIAFEEGLFRRQLFSYSARKKIETGKAGFLLLGVSLGQKKLAMIRDTSENKDYYCVEGDIILGSRVSQILKDKVILEKDNQTIELIQ